MQIRLNVSSLEDWARVNRMPTKMVTAHFTPLNQLVQWLQCLSSEHSIDVLLATLQNLRALNPAQLGRAAKDYRYEVEEPRMSEDCAVYIDQMKKDWERQRIAKSVALANRRGTVDGAGAGSDRESDGSNMELATEAVERQQAAAAHVADIFRSPATYLSYEPPTRLECLGEYLDSRYMVGQWRNSVASR